MMNKSKFYLTPDEVEEIGDKAWYEASSPDKAGLRVLEADTAASNAIAEASANHAIKTLVEQLVEDLEDKYELYLGMKEWGEDSLFHGYLMPAGFKQELLKLLGTE